MFHGKLAHVDVDIRYGNSQEKCNETNAQPHEGLASNVNSTTLGEREERAVLDNLYANITRDEQLAKRARLRSPPRSPAGSRSGASSSILTAASMIGQNGRKEDQGGTVESVSLEGALNPDEDKHGTTTRGDVDREPSYKPRDLRASPIYNEFVRAARESFERPSIEPVPRSSASHLDDPEFDFEHEAIDEHSLEQSLNDPNNVSEA